jgi:hypothetical protein
MTTHRLARILLGKQGILDSDGNAPVYNAVYD